MAHSAGSLRKGSQHNVAGQQRILPAPTRIAAALTLIFLALVASAASWP